jgi:amino acid adenylation domain-containing protein
VLFAGAAYVPIDPRAPWRRNRTAALDAGLAAVVIDAPRLPLLASFLEGQSLKLLLVDAPDAVDVAIRWERLSDAIRRPGRTPASHARDDLAYILYTSGSTGAPKGVAHTHRSALGFVEWVRERFGIRPADVFSAHAPFHFDLSISDIFVSLGSGASVRLISTTEAMLAPYLVRSITEWGITVWYSVPSILVSMLGAGDLEKHGLPTVRTLLFAGEVFPTPQLRRLRRALPAAGLYNLFGPTETNVCTYYEVPAEIPEHRTAPIPIGRACEHLETFVIDDEGREAGVGVMGTLWARGANVMAGYWSDPVRTAATLRADPRGAEGLAYCTGDIVRLLPDGNYEFFGRRDHMIKTRGFRVELGEIEAALVAHADVVEAVAVPIPDPALGNRIVATIVARSGAALDGLVVRAFCRDYVPAYMVPELIEVREALPRTSTGKADRAVLLAEWKERIGA